MKSLRDVACAWWSPTAISHRESDNRWYCHTWEVMCAGRRVLRHHSPSPSPDSSYFGVERHLNQWEMTSCPLSLKAIPAHSSSQRDIKQRMSAKISLQKVKRRKREGEKREEEREKKNAYIILWREEINWFTNGIKRRNTWVLHIKYTKIPTLSLIFSFFLWSCLSLLLSLSTVSFSPSLPSLSAPSLSFSSSVSQTEVFLTFFSLTLALFRRRISTTSPFPWQAA